MGDIRKQLLTQYQEQRTNQNPKIMNYRFKAYLYTIVSTLIFFIGLASFITIIVFLFIKRSEIDKIVHTIPAFFLLVFTAILIVGSGFLFNQGVKNRLRFNIIEILNIDQDDKKRQIEVKSKPVIYLYFNNDILLGTNLEGCQRRDVNGNILFIKYKGSNEACEKITEVIKIYQDTNIDNISAEAIKHLGTSSKERTENIFQSNNFQLKLSNGKSPFKKINNNETLKDGKTPLLSEDKKTKIIDTISKYNYTIQIKLKNPYAHPNGQAKDGFTNKIKCCWHNLTLDSIITFESSSYRCPIEDGQAKNLN